MIKPRRQPKIIIVFILCYSIFFSSQFVRALEKGTDLNGDHKGINAGAYYKSNNTTINRLIGEYKFSCRQGHGFSAERGNNLIDIVMGKSATVVGDNNILNGPDRKIINRDGSKLWIQDKYYRTAKEGINACFEAGEHGAFRYYDADGNPMQIEVPKDQYTDAVKVMEDKIKEGLVDRVTNPSEAKNLVKKGSLSYKQAVNLTKAGTIESLAYDATNGVITASSAFGISVVINYAVYRHNGLSPKEALKHAALTGIKSGGYAFGITIIVGQLAKAGAMKTFVPASEALVKTFGKDFSKMLIRSVGKSTETLTTSGLTTAAAKVVRGTVLTSTVTVIVLTIGDVIKLFEEKISLAQFLKNLSITIVSTAGATGGAIVGASAGSTVLPGAGTVIGGILGGVAGGMGSGILTEAVVSKFIRDDAEEMLEIIQNEFTKMSDEYIITKEEGSRITDCLQKLLTGEKLEEMMESTDRKAFAHKIIEPLFLSEIKTRKTVKIPTEEEMRTVMKKSLKNVVFIH